MKKTEKIEVRLSHEEKTALANLAEQEGRSVSDLVRGLIERYMSINTTRLPNKTPWLKFVAIAAAGFFAGHLATYFIAKMHSNSHSPIYSLEVNAGSDGVSIPLLAKDGETITAEIPSQNGNLRVKVKVSDVPESLQTATITLCRQVENRCEAIANPILKFNPNRQSDLSFKEKSGQGIYIRLSPTTPARK